MKYKIPIVSVCILIIAIIFLSGNNGQKNGTVRVGVIIPLSENAATIGEKVRRGIMIATEEANEPRIQFVFEDGGIEPRKALSAYQKLTNVDDISMFVGPFGPDQIMSIAPILKSEDVMLGVTLCENRFRSYPQIFCTYPSIPDQTESGVRIIQRLRLKKIGFLTQIGEVGDIIEHELKEREVEGGYTVAVAGRIKPGERDFRTLIAKIKAAQTDAIYFASLPEEGYIILQQLNALGYSGKIFAVFDAVDEKLAALGSAAEEVYLPGHISPIFQEKFVAQYTQKYGETPDLYAALGHSIAITLINGLRKNDFELKNIKEKIIGMTADTGITDFQFKPDQTVAIPVETLLFRDGKMREME